MGKDIVNKNNEDIINKIKNKIKILLLEICGKKGSIEEIAEIKKDLDKKYSKKKDLNKKEKVIILCGASCVGKDTLLNILKEKYGFNTLISYTTRPKRANEINGVDYFFVKKSEFINMIENEDFIEYKRYVTNILDKNKKIWFYGTSKKEFEKTNRKICILDADGIEKIKKYYGKNNLIIIYINSNEELKEKRAKEREDFNAEKWESRKQFDKDNFTKSFIDNEVNFIITNNDNKEYMECQADKIMKAYNILPNS